MRYLGKLKDPKDLVTKEYVDVYGDYALAAYATDTASGTVATFTDGADGIPVKSLVAQITPVQAGSGEPSPTNVRPITGWTGANVTRTGKNIMASPTPTSLRNINTAGTWSDGVYTRNGVTFTPIFNAQGNLQSVTVDGTASANIDFALRVNMSATSPMVGGKLNGCPSGGSTSTYQLIAQLGSSPWTTSADNGSGVTIATFTSSWSIFIRVYSGYVANNLVFQPMVRLASETDDSFEAYTGTTYTVDWTDEVFGGSVDVATGELVSDMRSTNNFGTWNLITTATPNYFETANIVTTLDLDRRAELLCNKYKTTTPSGSVTDDMCCGFTTGGRLRVRDTRFSTAADFAASLSDAQFVYPRATPTSAEFDPVEVKTLLGDNNIWADTGNIDLTYRADTTLYIQKLISNL